MTPPSTADRPRRRSLARMMAVVAIVAADLAGLRAVLPGLPNPGLVVMIVVLEVGLFRAASRRGDAGAFWVGFEASGWAYVLACSIFARASWRLARSAFEGQVLGRPIGSPPEMIRYLSFAGGLQLAVGLAIALAAGRLARAARRRARPPGDRGSTVGPG